MVRILELDPQGQEETESDVNGWECQSLCDGEEGEVRVDHHCKWINRQITYAAGTDNILWLLQVVHGHIPRMNLINFSTALHRVAKLALGCSSQVREQIVEHQSIWELQQAVLRYVIQMEANSRGGNGRHRRSEGKAAAGGQHQSEMRCLSIICWSCATLRLREETLFKVVARVSQSRIGELKSFELSNMLWAFAKLSMGRNVFFDEAAPRLLHRKAEQFSPQCLSTIVWALGTVKAHHPAVFTSFAAEITVHAHSMVPQGIANTAWAFARVRRQEVALFQALAESAVRGSVVWTFKVQELSNTAWAFATVGLSHAKLFEQIAEVAVRKRHELPPQNVANLLWAYAKLIVASCSRLFPPLLEVASSRLDQYKPQEVSAILWAAAKQTLSDKKAGCPVCRQFFTAVPAVFKSQLADFTSQALACMVEAYTLAEADDPDFMDAMINESLGRLTSFQPPSLCTLLRGIALKVKRNPHDAETEDTQEWTSKTCFHGACQLRTLAESQGCVTLVSNHIAGRISEMQPHNLSHLACTMDILESTGVTGFQALLNTRQLQSAYHSPQDLSAGIDVAPLVAPMATVNPPGSECTHQPMSRRANKRQSNPRALKPKGPPISPVEVARGDCRNAACWYGTACLSGGPAALLHGQNNQPKCHPYFPEAEVLMKTNRRAGVVEKVVTKEIQVSPDPPQHVPMTALQTRFSEVAYPSLGFGGEPWTVRPSTSLWTPPPVVALARTLGEPEAQAEACGQETSEIGLTWNSAGVNLKTMTELLNEVPVSSLSHACSQRTC